MCDAIFFLIWRDKEMFAIIIIFEKPHLMCQFPKSTLINIIGHL